MFDFKLFLLLIPSLLLALTVHEFSHGLLAYHLGDPTPKWAGRLTLNPLKHLDFFGTLTLFLTQAIGWAKPVPINPHYFKNFWRDMALVSLAGPISNLLLAIVMGLFYHFFNYLYLTFTKLSFLEPLVMMSYLGVRINLGLGIFNLLPIPPLDGSKILVKFLPQEFRYKFLSYEFIGFFIILILALSGVLSKVIYPVLLFLTNLVLTYTGIFFR
ncbi:MAG: site-2 protease family protein [Thermodesulfobacteriaceae bacterium]|nr:site-2 protease family protein [Thermodesulfobacteriaceae bacterium]MCX8041582.1 site-2 protease family protein [Thermodesulfobacteriaceae bacterium]MDW8136109.1 site-2 protease family protein [Thermodesulfobacterium sp.]